MRDFAKEFYKSRTWRDARAAYAAKRQYLCERCLKSGIVSPGEIVHHRIHLTPENIRDPSVCLAEENLELLCRLCHAAEHNPDRRFQVDRNGNLIIY